MNSEVVLGSDTVKMEIDKQHTEEIVNEEVVTEIVNECYFCNTTECTMWRRYLKDKIICNLCHLKRFKYDLPTALVNAKNLTTVVNMKMKESQTVRISSRKNKAKKKFGNGFVSIVKTASTKSRRSYFKKKPIKGVETVPSIIASKSVYHNGLMHLVGDVVSAINLDGGTYFAQIRGFLQDDFCEKMVVITWLLPIIPYPKQFDPMLFLPGLDEDTPRPLDCFSFVCRAPSDLFRSRITHPPFQKSQTDLSGLIMAAQQLKDEEDKI